LLREYAATPRGAVQAAEIRGFELDVAGRGCSPPRSDNYLIYWLKLLRSRLD
jgi:hypothetical protein